MSARSPHTESSPSTVKPLLLERDAFGALWLTDAQGQRHVVLPVRAFPIQSPEVGIALVDVDGHEVAWIDALADVAQPAQGLLREALAEREFVPVLQRIVAVSSFSTPCTWTVDTDRGRARFVLKGDEDIRRISRSSALLIADNHGIQYYVPDQFALDMQSKRILDRFM